MELKASKELMFTSKEVVVNPINGIESHRLYCSKYLCSEVSNPINGIESCRGGGYWYLALTFHTSNPINGIERPYRNRLSYEANMSY